MATTFEKLNLKNQAAIVILHAPPSFESEISRLAHVRVERTLDAAAQPEFVLSFVTRQDEVDSISAQLLAATKGDAIVWFAYPKGTSKKLKCDFNRDTGWAVLKDGGFDTVRAVSIDEDWTGLRFRRLQFIKNSIRR